MRNFVLVSSGIIKLCVKFPASASLNAFKDSHSSSDISRTAAIAFLFWSGRERLFPRVDARRAAPTASLTSSLDDRPSRGAFHARPSPRGPLFSDCRVLRVLRVQISVHRGRDRDRRDRYQRRRCIVDDTTDLRVVHAPGARVSRIVARLVPVALFAMIVREPK
jgi:hypothetical protein